MAHRMISARSVTRCAAPLFRLGLLLISVVLSSGAMAQTALADPTRPPAGISAPVTDSMEVTGPVLQSVIIPKKGRPVAVIGGQQVRLGEMYGESRLVRLTEREAVLESAAGTERLMLTPGIEKTNMISKTTTKTPSARRVQSGSTP